MNDLLTHIQSSLASLLQASAPVSSYQCPGVPPVQALDMATPELAMF